MTSSRIEKIVSVCCCTSEVLDTSNLNQSPEYVCHKSFYEKTNLKMDVKIPINALNFAMIELYPETRAKETPNSDILPTELNIICCPGSARVKDIKYDFGIGYDKVEKVNFSGHIGSMQLAFDLIGKFRECKYVTFKINNYNVNAPPQAKATFSQDSRKHRKVVSLQIINDDSSASSGNGEETFEVQRTHEYWRLHEILRGCKEHFPNLQFLDISICASGKNFDCVKSFVGEHPVLKGLYTVEITNDRVNTKLYSNQIQTNENLSCRCQSFASTPQPSTGYSTETESSEEHDLHEYNTIPCSSAGVNRNLLWNY